MVRRNMILLVIMLSWMVVIGTLRRLTIGMVRKVITKKAPFPHSPVTTRLRIVVLMLIRKFLRLLAFSMVLALSLVIALLFTRVFLIGVRPILRRMLVRMMQMFKLSLARLLNVLVIVSIILVRSLIREVVVILSRTRVLRILLFLNGLPRTVLIMVLPLALLRVRRLLLVLLMNFGIIVTRVKRLCSTPRLMVRVRRSIR